MVMTDLLIRDHERGAGSPGLRIVQLLQAPGWWLELPEFDEDTGARFTTKSRVLALALCEDPSGRTSVRPMLATGELSELAYLINEGDAGMLSKYQRRKRASGAVPEAAADDDTAEGDPAAAPAPAPWTPPSFEPPVGHVAGDAPVDTSVYHDRDPVDPMALAAVRRMTSTLLSWLADLLPEHPSGIVRDVRSQLRWIDGVLEQARRPTEQELTQLHFDDPELVEIDSVLADALGDLLEECRSL